MKALDLKKKYLDFFIQKNHQVIPNVSLIPENDPTALFINSGMHPLVPYLLGEVHPLGKRLVSNQRCLRTQDIEKIGDSSHLTFFEMLGNWSLGDYWKKEAIEWSWEFLTRKLNLEPKRIYVTCFAGDKDFPKDEESAKIWQSLGVLKEKIYFLGESDNWWSVGETGLCGPDTEIFYDTGKKSCGSNCRPGDNCGKYFEIWNNVFMEFNRLPNGKLERLKQKNIDTGLGVERTVAMLQGKDDVFQTELFSGLINQIEEISKKKYEGKNKKAIRIIADHLRAVSFAMADGVNPSNVEAGYIVRRLIRRAIRYGRQIGINQLFTFKIAQVVVDFYGKEYCVLQNNKELIFNQLQNEEEKFLKTLEKGLREFDKIKLLYSKLNNKDEHLFFQNGKRAFDFWQTYGFPPEMFLEEIESKNIPIDKNKFWTSYKKAFKEHQEKSKAGLVKKFAGGLVNHSREVTKLHTVTHLLHQALRQILGNNVHQIGSNITSERLRFDFNYSEKLTPKQIKQIEDLINEQIKKNLPVKMEIMSLSKAKKKGALAFFADKYGEKVKVYSIGSFSKEICGGPHVSSLGEIGDVKIIREESIGTGKRRIYAQITKK